MNTIATFLKQLRNESSLTQPELAKIMGVSTVLISMIESGQKNASTKFLSRLAEILEVHPGAIAPLAFSMPEDDIAQHSMLEQKMIDLGLELQKELIKKKAFKLKNHVQ
jgi:transcriptional regulator with XRE-family HTH domain